MLLLNTKLNVPPVRPSHVRRAELIQKLHKLPDYKLALIVASAGYGKTALVSEWIAQSSMRVVWFSIDVGDNDPVRFWDYVVAAIQSAYPDTGEQTLTLLHEPQPLPVETILSTLINELSALPDVLTLVLDDYHVIDSASIHEGLAFLVEHMPSQMRLVMTTRAVQAWADEGASLPESLAQAGAVKTFGDLPLIVLTSRLNQQTGWQAMQAELLQLSSNSQQMIADNSGHNIEIDQPERGRSRSNCEDGLAASISDSSRNYSDSH